MNAKLPDTPFEPECATQEPSSEFDSLLQGTVSRAAPDEALPAIEAAVDGKRIRIVAQDEIVLECGNASITLRRNGRIIIKGTYVETCSEGTNRIKGGQVRIN
jgi:hypothetical protein